MLADQVLSAGDCLSMFDIGTVGRSGLLKQMRTLLGWWTVYFSNDWAAVSHYSPGVLVWFLLKHVTSRNFNRPRRDFSPLRASIASMAMIPWERLVAQCEEYGVLGVAHGLRIVLGGSGPRRTMVV
jgi:hypothetical protein